LKEKPMQIGLAEKDLIVVEAGGHFIVDFGREMSGGVRILLSFSDEKAKIRLRLGESVAETCAEIGEKNALNAHTYRDITLPVVQLSDCSYFDSGFRFLRVDIAGGKVNFKAVVAEENVSEVNRIGSFSCSDETLNTIYETAAYTIDLCVRRGVIWDGIKRDRLVWIGDIYPELLSLENLTGDLTCVKNSLDFVKSQTPATEWMCGFPMYSMWWIIILREYFRRTGDVGYVREQTQYIKDLLNLFDKHIAEDGTTHYPYNFVDWPTQGKEDEPAGVLMINEMALDAATELLVAVGESEAHAKVLLTKLQKQTPCVKEKKQIIALKSYVRDSITEKERELLLSGGAKGLSTFMSYFILSAIDKEAGTQKALEIAKEYYGAMLALGATTFWEDFDMDWVENSSPITRRPKAGERDVHGDFGAYCYLGFRHSLCHGWSSGVLPFLVEKVLGVTVENGGKKVKVNPSLGGLSWAKGDVPVAGGVVKVSIENGKVTVNAPEGVEVVQGK
ncbi:MAG: alpha-L-rhamnosidase, partial [Clostridia bacterium]|nr:alpha-L-rhamnosidase [Clostridia bacterium]